MEILGDLNFENKWTEFNNEFNLHKDEYSFDWPIQKQLIQKVFSNIDFNNIWSDFDLIIDKLCIEDWEEQKIILDRLILFENSDIQ